MARPKQPHKPQSVTGLHGHDEASSEIDLDVKGEAKEKLLRERARKAKNQRRYYANNKDVQQAKARDRSARNCLRIKQIWFSNSNDGYKKASYSDVDTPPLVPVFDLAFTANTGTTAIESVGPSFMPVYSSDTSGVEGVPGAVKFDGWESWTASRRMEAIRLWIVDAVSKYRPVECWGEEWHAVKDRDSLAVDCWFHSMKQRIWMGRSALRYLECVMEGELSASVEEWRDLYAQSHQLACQLWRAVLGIEHRLDSAVSSRPPL